MAQLPTGADKHRAVRQMFDTIAPRYEMVNRLMTFGLDAKWRSHAVKALALPAGATVLDLASGTGDLCVELTKAGHHPIAVDYSFGMLVADHRSDAPKVQADACVLPFPDASVDGVTCGFALRNFVSLDAFFTDVARVVKPGGRIALLDAAEPEQPVLRFGHGIYFRGVVPLIGGLLSDGKAYRYLPKSLEYLPPADQMLASVERAGFVRVHRSLLFGGAAQLIARDSVTVWRRVVKAVTRPLPHDLDLNDWAGGDGYLFVRDGVGLAGRGVAARIPAAEIGCYLRGVESDDTVGQPGCGPVAIGTMPFRPGDPWDLVIPRVVVGKGPDGHRWVTRIDGADDDLIGAPRPDPQTATFTITPGVDPGHYLAAVTAARDAVRSGHITKAVIAHDIEVRSDKPLDVHATLLRLRAAFGSSYRYCVDGFIGASPELLVSRHGDVVRSHPLAGTAPRYGDPVTDARLAAELIASTKNQIEHRIVIETVHDTLLPWCSYLDWEPEPSIVQVANVQHLGSLCEGRLSDPPPDVLELATALSPTPALGGHPRAEALALIAAVEGFERGRYGGAVGWTDAAGNGTWAVAIRCAELSPDRRTARLFAGGGIVADSEPLAELAETQAKFQAMLSAILRA